MPPQCTCCATGSSSGTHEVYRNLVETISVSGARAGEGRGAGHFLFRCTCQGRAGIWLFPFPVHVPEMAGSWPFPFPVHVPGKGGKLVVEVG